MLRNLREAICGPQYVIEVAEDHEGKWRWHARCPENNKIVADSGQGYSSKAHAWRAAESMRRARFVILPPVTETGKDPRGRL